MLIFVSIHENSKTHFDTVHASLASAYPPSGCSFTGHFLWNTVIPGLFAHHWVPSKSWLQALSTNHLEDPSSGHKFQPKVLASGEWPYKAIASRRQSNSHPSGDEVEGVVPRRFNMSPHEKWWLEDCWEGNFSGAWLNFMRLLTSAFL